MRPTLHVTFTCYCCIHTDNTFVLTLGQWTVPSVSGQCCPPTESFIIEKISHNKGIMFGGLVTNGNWNTTTNSVYLYQLSHNTMVSYKHLKLCFVSSRDMICAVKKHNGFIGSHVM